MGLVSSDAQKLDNKRILIICTANSCRSQMAETFLKEINSDLEVYSAGTMAAPQIHPLTIEVMKEIGFNLEGKRPADVSKYINDSWDYIITVCDDAKEACPVFQGEIGKRIHYRFIDPATEIFSEDKRIELFRKVRGEINEKIEEFYNDFLVE